MFAESQSDLEKFHSRDYNLRRRVSQSWRRQCLHSSNHLLQARFPSRNFTFTQCFKPETRMLQVTPAAPFPHTMAPDNSPPEQITAWPSSPPHQPWPICTPSPPPAWRSLLNGLPKFPCLLSPHQSVFYTAAKILSITVINDNGMCLYSNCICQAPFEECYTHPQCENDTFVILMYRYGN